MDIERYRQIHNFAEKYLKLFSSAETMRMQIEPGEFAKECLALGFNMDRLKAFDEQYPNDGGINEIMRGAFQNTDDVDLIGSALFLQWRYYTHWDQTDVTRKEIRQWFVSGLQRLSELTSFPTFHGEVEKIVIVSDDSAYEPPAPGQEIRQRLTLNRNGSVSLTRYFSGDFSKVPPTPDTKERHRYKGRHTGDIMDCIAAYFRECYGEIPAPGYAYWYAELTDTEGEKRGYCGPLSDDLEFNGYGLSAKAREVLGIESLWMFDECGKS